MTFTAARIRFGAATLLCVMWLVARVAAQEHPDFSGRWRLQQTSADVEMPVAMDVRQTLQTTNVRGEPMAPFYSDIAITRIRPEGAAETSYRIGVRGGFISGVAGPPGTRPPESRIDRDVHWDGAALLILESGRSRSPSTGDVSWERNERWTMLADGRIRIDVTTGGSGEPSRSGVFIYLRQ